MLIVTSDASGDPKELCRNSGWPPPCVFVALPGHGRRQSDLASLESDCIVVECLDPPRSGAWLLAAILGEMPHLIGAAKGPILLATAPIGPKEARALLRDALARPRAVETRTGEGRLEGLVVGAAVRGHPRARAAFEAISARDPAPEEVAAVIEAALAGAHHHA